MRQDLQFPKVQAPEKGVIFLKSTWLETRIFSSFSLFPIQNSFLNFGLKVCRRDKRLAFCLANCSPDKCLYMQTNAAVMSDNPLGGTIFSALTIQKDKTIF